MTEREALKLALEALEDINKLSVGENAICLPAEIDTAMDAIKEVLAQPEQEQVAYTGNGTAGREADVKPTGFFFQADKRQPEQERPPNCGTGYCSCIECVMEPEQKPVAWLYIEPDNPHLNVHYDDVDVSQFPHDEWFPVYRSPPQRKWVGLTDEEKLVANQMWRVMDADGFIKAIEAKLKQKNGYAEEKNT